MPVAMETVTLVKPLHNYGRIIIYHQSSQKWLISLHVFVFSFIMRSFRISNGTYEPFGGTHGNIQSKITEHWIPC